MAFEVCVCAYYWTLIRRMAVIDPYGVCSCVKPSPVGCSSIISPPSAAMYCHLTCSSLPAGVTSTLSEPRSSYGSRRTHLLWPYGKLSSPCGFYTYACTCMSHLQLATCLLASPTTNYDTPINARCNVVRLRCNCYL